MGRKGRGGQDGLGQRLTRSEPELLADDVQARDQLGHAMLHLEPGVDLEEVGRAVRSPQELGRGGIQVRRHGDTYGRIVQATAFLEGQPRRRRLLDELLVPPLDRAVALADRHDLPGLVAQELDLDVPCRPDLPFQVDGPVTEGGERLRRGRAQGLGQIGGPSHTPHPPSPTAGRGLDQQREPDRLRFREDSTAARRIHWGGIERARDTVHPDRTGQSAGMQLVAQRIDGVR